MLFVISLNGCSEPILTELIMSLLEQTDGRAKGIFNPQEAFGPVF